MIRIYLTTFAAEDDARRVSEVLIAERLAACATRMPSARSLYQWKGRREESPECVVLFKVPAPLGDAFAARLAAVHPYEVPEIVWWEAGGVSEPYLRWAWETCGLGLDDKLPGS